MAQSEVARTTYGFPSAYGAAAAALADPEGAWLLNPASLTRAERGALWSTGGFDRNGESWSVGTTQRTSPRGTFGLSYAHERFDKPAAGLGTRRHRVHLGSAWPAGRAWSLGGSVQLLSQAADTDLDTSFGIDAGVQWHGPDAGAHGRRARLQAGLLVRNALEPRVVLGDASTHERRTWNAALAWTAWQRHDWATSLAAGIEAPHDARRALSAVALLDAAHGVRLALGVHDARLRAAAGISRGSWTLGYALADAPEGLSHGVDVGLRFGPVARWKHVAARRARELEIASRLVALAEQDRTARELDWRRKARAALEHGEFERAAALYHVLLETLPGDVRAREGLLRAQHGAAVSEADSLLLQHDRAGAVRALERAVALAPDDSTSIERLEQLQLAARDASRTRTEVARHFNAGIEAYAKQDYRGAVAAFDAVLRLDARHVEATSYREQALRSYNVRVGSFLQQARARLEAGDFRGARAHVRRVLELEPGHKQARRLSANIERAAGAAQRQAERARQAQQQAHTEVARGEDAAPPPVDADVRVRYDQGMQLYRSGDLVQAMHTWEEVAARAPHFEDVDRYLLRIYRVTGLESYTEGRLQDAVERWEKALALEPDNAQLRRYLNRALAKLARAQSVEPGR